MPELARARLLVAGTRYPGRARAVRARARQQAVDRAVAHCDASPTELGGDPAAVPVAQHPDDEDRPLESSASTRSPASGHSNDRKAGCGCPTDTLSPASPTSTSATARRPSSLPSRWPADRSRPAVTRAGGGASSSTSSCACPPALVRTDPGAAGQHATHGFALAAHPGESQGRPSTNASSRFSSKPGLRVPDARVPDGHTICREDSGSQPSLLSYLIPTRSSGSTRRSRC